MNTPDHSPACAESPHFCICSHTTTCGLTPKPADAGTLVIPDALWDDFDPSTVKVSGPPEFISGSEYQARTNLVPNPYFDGYPITGPLRDCDLPHLDETAASLRVQLDSAQEQVRFLSRLAFTAAVSGTCWMIYAICKTFGWW